MSFHPNDVARRARAASVAVSIGVVLLVGAFFRTQVIENARYAMKSEENRLREVPLPAPRGIIVDRNGEIIAENVPGYSVSVLAPSADSLRAALERLNGTIEISNAEIEAAVRRYRRAPNRPTVILPDAPFDVISVLEEHRVEFPGLIIQSAPKRYYPDGPAIAAFIGYTGEITETELAQPEYEGYKAGQLVGKGGLEKQYETRLRGREGVRFVEVDARGRVVREAGARQDLAPIAADSLPTNIDMRLQRFIVELFGDSLVGGVVAMEPTTGQVLALHSAPSFDPNRFIGGISQSYWNELRDDPRRPLYNKAIQGRYPPASTWKLATSIIAMQDERFPITLDTRMPTPCTGGFLYGRYFRCHDPNGHGNVTLQQAIEKSCDVYFYQLGLKVGLSRLLAGGVRLGFRSRTGIDIPNEAAPRFPTNTEYYNQLYGPRGWTNAVVLNLSIGQGENDQTVVSMARFYTALATDGHAAKPEIVHSSPEREHLIDLRPEQMDALRAALAGVVSRGSAVASRLDGVVLAGKTGTAQTSAGWDMDHAWFVGFAPADEPKIVVSIMLEFGLSGSRAARIASSIIGFHLKQQPEQLLSTDG